MHFFSVLFFCVVFSACVHDEKNKDCGTELPDTWGPYAAKRREIPRQRRVRVPFEARVLAERFNVSPGNWPFHGRRGFDPHGAGEHSREGQRMKLKYIRNTEQYEYLEVQYK